MSKTEMIRARVEPNLKQQAEEIFRILGLSATDAITIFYKQVTLNQGLPFEVNIPNKITCKAMNNVLKKKNLIKYDSLNSLIKKYQD